jgi:hypothetical protein
MPSGVSSPFRDSASPLLSAAAATHLWIENVEFAAESDKHCVEWEWDVEAERWGQSKAGGTDPSLGFMARFGIRSAWFGTPLDVSWDSQTGKTSFKKDILPRRSSICREASRDYAHISR